MHDQVSNFFITLMCLTLRLSGGADATKTNAIEPSVLPRRPLKALVSEHLATPLQ
jgi:hypothetical protein